MAVDSTMEKSNLNHLLKVLNHKISIETSQFKLNLYLKLSLTSFKNKIQQKKPWHYINYVPVLNQEILINPELSHPRHRILYRLEQEILPC